MYRRKSVVIMIIKDSSRGLYVGINGIWVYYPIHAVIFTSIITMIMITEECIL